MPYTVRNRAAEYGSEVLSGAGTITSYYNNPIIAIKILADATFTAMTATENTVGTAYWVSASPILAGETILGNFTSVTISGGAIQAIFDMGA